MLTIVEVKDCVYRFDAHQTVFDKEMKLLKVFTEEEFYRFSDCYCVDTGIYEAEEVERDFNPSYRVFMLQQLKNMAATLDELKTVFENFVPTMASSTTAKD